MKTGTRRGWSFRQKVFFSALFTFACFLALLAPFSEYLIERMVRETLSKTSKTIIETLKSCPNDLCMADYIQKQEKYVFFRVTLIDKHYKVIYDVRPEHNEVIPELIPSEHPEIDKAFKMGEEFLIGYSLQFKEKLVYLAEAFTAQGQGYVLRISIPYSQVEILIQQFRLGLYTINTIFMITFLLGIGWIFFRLSRPIRQISDTIRPYAEGQVDTLPKIEIRHKISNDFDTLALTLNSLSDKVRMQIRNVVDERNEKESILDSLMEGVVAIDGEGVIRYANQTFAKMVGLSRRELFGHRMAHLKAPKKEPLGRCLNLIKIAQSLASVVTDSIALDDKVFLDLIVVPKPFRSGAIVVIQDKSSQRQVVEMGKEFIANASHELRTPITIIKGFAETLQDLKEISPTMLAEITEKIVRNCTRMDTLVKNLLTLADLENIPQSRFQPCDLVVLADNCMHLLQTLTPGTHIRIEKSKERLMVDADADLLELAIMNLLENGVKYSNPPAHLTLHLKETKKDVIIAIEDKGIGIPPEDVPHIFERFYTVNKARSRKLGGAGLGLSIVKTIVDKHEGTLSVVSELGQGTTFTLTLPKSRRWVDDK
jgi:two-component system, OmpR family, phosphate regulon sensor histidine kinase PhoR